MKIGVFDSGVGGLSVLKSLVNARLFDELIYYGDTARVPYGVKDRETIVRFSLEAADFFAPFKLDMLIIACNTVSAWALRELRDKCEFPVLGVIDAGVLAVNSALADKNSEILVLGTKATINSKQYQKRLLKAGFSRVNALATGLFVPMVEEGIFEGAVVEAVFKHYFTGLKKPDALILGCTHFPLLSKALSEYFGSKTRLIHSGDAIVAQLQNEFKLSPKKHKSKIKFYASADIKALKNTAKIWLGVG